MPRKPKPDASEIYRRELANIAGCMTFDSAALESSIAELCKSTKGLLEDLATECRFQALLYHCATEHDRLQKEGRQLDIEHDRLDEKYNAWFNGMYAEKLVEDKLFSLGAK